MKDKDMLINAKCSKCVKKKRKKEYLATAQSRNEVELEGEKIAANFPKPSEFITGK